MADESYVLAKNSGFIHPFLTFYTPCQTSVMTQVGVTPFSSFFFFDIFFCLFACLGFPFALITLYKYKTNSCCGLTFSLLFSVCDGYYVFFNFVVFLY